MATYKQHGSFKLPKIPVKTDQLLHCNQRAPLNSIVSGSALLIAGAPRSGKSNLMANLFKMKNPKGEKKMNLKDCFDNIFIVSPSLTSFQTNLFEDLEEEYKYDSLIEFLDNYLEIIDKDEEKTCVVLDDIGTETRTPDTLKRFHKMLVNRAHENLTIILLVQDLIMIDRNMRKAFSMFIFFDPITQAEKEHVYSIIGLRKKTMESFFEFFFQERFDSCLVDMSRIHSNKFVFYRNMFNKVDINLLN